MKKMTTYQLAATALFTAIMCILGPMSIPIGPVPISLTNFVIYLAVLIIGKNYGTISCIVYILLGAVGLPVFSSYTGGIGKLFGPTGGYIIGFIPMAFILGIAFEKIVDKKWMQLISMAGATVVLYVLGTAWFVMSMKCEVWYALTICVFPFLLGDAIKIIIAYVIGNEVKKRLAKSGLGM